jgi:glucose/mannose-6-phosphate isomerase
MDNPIDKENMIEILRSFPKMVETASALGDDITFQKDFIDSIVVCGMGGSGYNGDLLKAYLQKQQLRIDVIKDYDLPFYAQKKTLLFALSYSGNTEETLSACRLASHRGCKIISLSSGGKLQEMAKMNHNLHIIVPSGIQPRLSTPYQFIPLLNVLSFSGVIPEQEETIKKTIADLKNSAEKIEAGGKEIAGKLKGKIPLIYSSQRMQCLAEKWKTDINENAKTHAFYNTFPEFNHNELCAFENTGKDYHVLIVSDKEDPDKIKNRIKTFKKTVSQYKVAVTEIGISGDSMLTKLLSGVWMGLFMSYYLALEYGRDPTPVNIIEKFKKELPKV